MLLRITAEKARKGFVPGNMEMSTACAGVGLVIKVPRMSANENPSGLDRKVIARSILSW